ncbi:MAG: FadR/GntR family transcriptional regulator [Christensenellales bacterium]
MERFGVSRSTVREAVKILQTEHIVDIRQGQGTFCAPCRGWRATRWACAFADQEELIAQLLETRLLIEPSVAWRCGRPRTG